MLRFDIICADTTGDYYVIIDDSITESTDSGYVDACNSQLDTCFTSQTSLYNPCSFS